MTKVIKMYLYLNTNSPKAFKPETNLTTGSPSTLLFNILRDRGHDVVFYDPFVDKEKPDFVPSVFLIGTKHEEFQTWKFPEGSSVIDPHRYIKDQTGVKVIRVGSTR